MSSAIRTLTVLGALACAALLFVQLRGERGEQSASPALIPAPPEAIASQPSSTLARSPSAPAAEPSPRTEARSQSDPASQPDAARPLPRLSGPRSQPPAAPGPAALSVRVLDEQGNAVPGARVLAADLAQELRAPRGPVASADHVRYARSELAGEDGVARFTRLAPGRWRPWAGQGLWHYHPGPEVELDGIRAPLEVSIRIRPLPEHQLLRGSVTDPAGAPVARARVHFYRREGDRLLRRSTVSGADGRFAFGLEGADARGALLVTHGLLGSVVVDGVGAGDAEVEARLRALRELVLDPRGRQGAMLERFEARFHLLVLGLWAEDPAPERRRPDEPLYWGVPDVPFQVSVRARGYASQTFGPFEPSEIGRGLRVDLEPLRVARGRVLLAGEPVAGARVWLEHPSAETAGEESDLELRARPLGSMPRASMPVRSDAQGRFELFLEPSLVGTFDLVARSAPSIGARLAGITVDARSEQGDFELALLAAPLGAIRGVVLTPPGISPRSVWVQLEGPGESFHTGVGEQGRFEVDSLAAGRWKLAVHERGHDSGAEGSDVGERLDLHVLADKAPAWSLYDPSRFVDLAPGETVEVQLDLSRPPACRLEGAFLLDGRPLAPRHDGFDGFFRISGRRAQLELEGAPDPSSRSHLGPDGTFLLGVEQPGAYRLRLQLPLDIGSELIVLDRVELRAGTVSWSLDLSTAQLAVQSGSSLGSDSFTLVHRWRGPGELRVSSRFPVRDGERRQLVFPHAPSGPGTLLNVPVGAPSTVLTELDVAPVGETLVELP